MKKLFCILILLAQAGAYAVPCGQPRHRPDGAEHVLPTCGKVAVFLQNGKYGFSDADSGKILVPAQYDEVLGPVDDFLTGVRRGGKWAFVQADGTPRTRFQYDSVQRFPNADSFAIVAVQGRFGMIDGNGTVRQPLVYERMDGYRQDTAGEWRTVACRDGQCGFLNARGETVIKLQYEDAGHFGMGMAPVKQAGQWGYINEQGEVMVPFVYDRAGAFGPHAGPSSCVNVEKDGQQFSLDVQGKLLDEWKPCIDPPPLI